MTDWTGTTVDGATVVHRVVGATWLVRCGCAREFEASSERVRMALTFARGRATKPSRLRCVECTSRARACAVRGRGGLRAKRTSKAETGVVSRPVVSRSNDRRQESDARDRSGAAAPSTGACAEAGELLAPGSASPPNPRLSPTENTP